MITWPAQPVSKEQEDNTHGGHVTSLSTLDFMMPLVLDITKLVFPEV